MGSSIVRDAFTETHNRLGGRNLGLQRLNVDIWWQGRGGMVVFDIKKRIMTLLSYEDPPQFIILHLGANDIGDIKIGYLRNHLKVIINWLQRKLPATTIIWSQILPRLKWRYSHDSDAMEKARYRLNNSIATHVMNLGGLYIRYPDIKSDRVFLESDGVHLTKLGNNIFLNTIQGALEYFIQYPYGYSYFPC